MIARFLDRLRPPAAAPEPSGLPAPGSPVSAELLRQVRRIEIRTRHLVRTKQRMNEILMKHTGQTLTKLEEDTDKKTKEKHEEKK